MQIQGESHIFFRGRLKSEQKYGVTFEIYMGVVM